MKINELTEGSYEVTNAQGRTIKVKDNPGTGVTKYKPRAVAGRNPYSYPLAVNGKPLGKNMLSSGIERGITQQANAFVRKWMEIQEVQMGEEIENVYDDVAAIQPILDRYQSQLNKELASSGVMRGL